MTLLIFSGIARADPTIAEMNCQGRQSDTTEGSGIAVYQMKNQGTGDSLNGTIGLPPDGESV